MFDNLTINELEECISTLREKYQDSYYPQSQSIRSKIKEKLPSAKDEIEIDNQSDDRDTLSLQGDVDDDKYEPDKNDNDNDNDKIEVDSSCAIDDAHEDNYADDDQ